MGMVQNRDLEGTGTDCPCVPKDESTRQTSSLDGQGVFEELRNKERTYHLWKEGQVSQEVFKGAARACRKKLWRPKISLNLKGQLL